MLDEKTIRKIRSNCADVWQWNNAPDGSNINDSKEICKWFPKIYILLSIILEEIDEDDNERDIRGYEYKSGIDWLDFLPLTDRDKK